ncbi:hypothetical protein Aeqsu_2248 [Aequorivita sublithincola DSM 14238]|uniref:Uncharacterized protein n=1 Tax=Aequorivita sublithincola (strain DSM 14238 / LMG 21431 / ACAM 643 / 9-3) TaxID=746697 RepID=I3YXJ0_AEQSU|nr:hypothetical protein [Aequorivita sublithincola]AFL81708.1 hypothetical protein Aeqsu_2248 [Aequorivita sublithincola DSM 14238]
MMYSSIYFKQEGNDFSHNLKSDFACFALWKPARPYRDRIRNLLATNFDILLETEIVWTDKNLKQNAKRLYEIPIRLHVPAEKWPVGHEKKIGDNKFILFVVKDNKPDYTYAMSVSKKIELSNLNVVKTKYQIRDWIKDDLKVNYAVHSTNNIYEFFFQAPLILGADIFKKLIGGEKIIKELIEKDLEGADGWKNWQEVFEILNLTNNYLVLRGFETLPINNSEKDLDILTDNYQRFASALGAAQLSHQPYKGNFKVNNEEVSLDMRFIGDKYYDIAWAKEILQTKMLRNNVYIPRKDHYFYSLLFHAKVQKPKVKAKYIDILEKLAKDLNFEWYKTEKIENDIAMGQILNGYFRSQGYFYENPIDRAVYKNESIIKFLQNNKFSLYKLWLKKIETRVLIYFPTRVISNLKRLRNKF